MSIRYKSIRKSLRNVDQLGMTLVELVIAIAVAGIAVAGLAAAYASMVGRSADPMIQTQALVAAESIMEEILLKPFSDPDTVGDICVDEADDDNRATFDDVCDYHNYTSNGVVDQSGNLVSGLSNYDVSVSVTPSAYAGVTAANSLLIQVTVTSPLNSDTVLTAYRLNY
jgi:MSHA pilin protein MshD